MTSLVVLSYGTLFSKFYRRIFGIVNNFIKREIMRYSDISKHGYIGELVVIRW